MQLNSSMFDPDFDPLDDLHQLTLTVAEQHRTIQGLVNVLNDHNASIKHLNNALRVLKQQVIVLESRLNETNRSTTDPRPLR